MRRLTPFVLAATVASCVSQMPHGAEGAASPVAERQAVVHGFSNGLAGTHAGPQIKLRVATDSASDRQAVLVVEYPAQSNDPASRDVQLDADNTNWSIGNGLSFRVRPARATRLSISFVDRNRVAYTWWSNLQAEVWQTVRVDFTAIRPNPYFQPPDANLEAPINLTKVEGLGFAPQSSSAGRLEITQIALVK